MSETSVCLNCGGHAELLCDYKLGGVIGWIVQESKPFRRERRYFDITKMPYTCDVPLCPACATLKGRYFISGPQAGSESIDYCPYHAAMPEPRWLPITEEELAEKRREIAAFYRRKAIAIVEEPA